MAGYCMFQILVFYQPFIEEEADDILVVLTSSIEHCNLIQAFGSCSC